MMITTTDVWQYVGVFSALVVSAFGAPIPEELPIATGGVLVGREWNDPTSGMRWWIMLPICIFGVVLCDTILYLVGRKYGSWLVQRKWVQKRVVSPEKLERIKLNFDKYGIGILLGARLMPGIRTPVFICAGMIRMPFYRFLLADGIYAIPGVNLLFWLGYWFTNQFLEILHKIENYRPIVIACVLSALAGVLLYHVLKRKVTTGDPEEIPVIGRRVAEISHHRHLEHLHEEHPEMLAPDAAPTLPEPGDPKPETESPPEETK
ncbi:MAG: DedA family protein [Zavarzinella sp.]